MQKIKSKDIQAFIRTAKRLDKIMINIREYCPEATLYAEQETLNLMVGPPHDKRTRERQDRVAESATITGMDSGAW